MPHVLRQVTRRDVALVGLSLVPLAATFAAAALRWLR